MAREFHEIGVDLLHEACSIPSAERKDLPPRKAKEGTFDISTARLFWDRPAFEQRLTLALQTHFPTIICNGVCVYFLVAGFYFCAILPHFKDYGVKKNLLLTCKWPVPKLCVQALAHVGRNWGGRPLLKGQWR